MTRRSTKHRARAWRIAAIVAVSVGTLLGVAAALLAHFRDPLVSMKVRDELASAGFVCEHVVAHAPGMFAPTTITVRPMRCTSPRGALQSVRFVKPLVLHLEHSRMRSMSCDELAIDLRPSTREISLNVIGDIQRFIGLDQPPVDLTLALAESAESDMPELFARYVVISRGGERGLELHALHMWPAPHGRAMSGERLHLDAAGILGEGTMTGRATTQHADVRVVFGALHLGIEGHALDTQRPRIDASIALSH